MRNYNFGKKFYIILAILITLAFTTKVFASLTLGSASIIGTTTSTIDFGSGNDLYLQTNGGKVGIGTTTPGYALDVVGTGKLSTGLITNKIYPVSNSTTAIQINKADGTTNVLNVDTTNSRIGIGTASPGYNLDVNGTLNVSGTGTMTSLTLDSSGANGLFGADASATAKHQSLTFYSPLTNGQYNPITELGYQGGSGGAPYNRKMLFTIEGNFYDLTHNWTEEYLARTDSDGSNYRPLAMGQYDGYSDATFKTDFLYMNSHDGTKTSAEMIGGASPQVYIPTGSMLSLGSTKLGDGVLEIHGGNAVIYNARYSFVDSGGTGQGSYYGNTSGLLVEAAQATGVIQFKTNGGTPGERMRIGATGNVGIGTTASGSPLTVNGNIALTASSSGAGVVAISSTAPTIASGFGSSPSVPSNNGTAAFTVNVGTGGSATSGVLTMPTATTGWNCFVNDITAAAAHVAYDTRQTASTVTSVTLENQTTSTGAAVVWAASDILRLNCMAF